MFQKQKLFSSLKENQDFSMTIKLNGKILYPNDSVKYLGVKIDSKLNWKSRVNDTATKLEQASAMLNQVRDFVNASIPNSIYYALPESVIVKTSIQLTVFTFSRKRLLE